MAYGMGQVKNNGHSHGSLGHGGHKAITMHTSGSNHHSNNPHTQGSNAGHTMMDQHGGMISAC